MPVAVASEAVPPAAARVVAGVVLGLDGDGGSLEIFVSFVFSDFGFFLNSLLLMSEKS